MNENIKCNKIRHRNNINKKKEVNTIGNNTKERNNKHLTEE